MLRAMYLPGAEDLLEPLPLTSSLNELNRSQLNRSYTKPVPVRSDFSVWGDYLGLVDLVKNVQIAAQGIPESFTGLDMPVRRPAPSLPLSDPLGSGSTGLSPSLSPTSDEEVDRLFAPISRERFDSLGSSGSSSSASSDFYLNGRESDLELGFASLFGDLRLDSPPNSLDGYDFSRQRRREPPSASLSSRDRDILFSVAARRRASRMASGGVGSKSQVCVFCRNNGESETVYASYMLKDCTGKVTCPVLMAYTCPLCHATGEEAHTIKYCPQNTNQLPNVKSLKTARTSTGKKRPV
uniref:Nanos-like protein n=1 Tax=Branchiostoma belcheri TaxID=7741 RepID=M9SYY9_BRABE|nr:Nanos-like protein [Branchiostoma belcheri]